MSREVRRVPADWQHPKFTAENAPFYQAIGKYIPLDSGDVAAEIAEWDERAAKWAEGLRHDWENPGTYIPIEDEFKGMTYAEFANDRPDPDRYMPNWPEDQRTHFMLYEITSEGTPQTPAFATIEELADYLVKNGITYFAGETCTREEWMEILKNGKTIGMGFTVTEDGEMTNIHPT